MSETSILCGVDGSPDSEAALRVAARLSRRLGARLVLAYVAQPLLMSTEPLARPVPSVQPDLELRAGEELLEQLAAGAGVEVETRVAVGDPAERLADLADADDVELIVVGSRGRGAFRSAFLGSVSTALIGLARKPVLVVPPGAAGAAQGQSSSSEA